MKGKMMEWIDREKESPEDNEILCLAGNEIFICHLKVDKWGKRYTSYDIRHISRNPQWTHWAKLPKPPSDMNKVLESEFGSNYQAGKTKDE